ncbi:MAG: hypothetical protein AAFV90_26115 [Cyanobacteria bacterium J06634_5]
MTTSPLYCNDLTLSPYARAIPYAADRLAIDAQQTGTLQTSSQQVNYGFKNLKIKPSLIETIPELADDASLKALVKAINQSNTCFFTVGCFSERSQTEQGHRRRGYLSFAWNCAGCVQDAINYFALYFHFEKSLRENGFNQPVQFKWIIQESAFSDAKIDGFACAVHLETRALSSPEQADLVWQISLRMIGAYLETVKTLTSTPIYKPLSDCSNEEIMS